MDCWRRVLFSIVLVVVVVVMTRHGSLHPCQGVVLPARWRSRGVEMAEMSYSSLFLWRSSGVDSVSVVYGLTVK